LQKSLTSNLFLDPKERDNPPLASPYAHVAGIYFTVKIQNPANFWPFSWGKNFWPFSWGKPFWSQNQSAEKF